MNRRSFIKRTVALLGLAFVAPKELLIEPLCACGEPLNSNYHSGISSHDLREEARRNLADWYAKRIDEYMFKALTV